MWRVFNPNNQFQTQSRCVNKFHFLRNTILKHKFCNKSWNNNVNLNLLYNKQYSTININNKISLNTKDWRNIIQQNFESIFLSRGFGKFSKEKKNTNNNTTPKSTLNETSNETSNQTSKEQTTQKQSIQEQSVKEQSVEEQKKENTSSSSKSDETMKKEKDNKNKREKSTRVGNLSETSTDDSGFSFSKLSPWMLVLPIIALLLAPDYHFRSNQNTITFHQFRIQMLEAGLVDHIEVINKTTARVFLRDDLDHDRLASKISSSDDRLNDNNNLVYGRWNSSTIYEFNIGDVRSFENKLENAQRNMGIDISDYVPVQYIDEVSLKGSLLNILTSSPILTMLVIYGMYRMIRRNAPGLFGGTGSGSGIGGSRSSGPFGGLFDVTKANFKVINKGEKVKTKFSDVAGLDNAKEEVYEFVKFLKNPEQYTKLGARIPKGALLVGPPGTGKTLLARAVAGEADCPFFSISGSDFVEMFVGVGPSRVRNLFEEARKNAPCIIFIDEIDAVGRKRSKGGFAGGNDERENTLNQLLVEMDGFKTDTNIVILAGTNRQDILDSALLRPGRFDRQIQIDKPDLSGRIEIFLVHLKKIKLKEKIQDIAKRMATLTPGFSGADIANVVNEASLRAARKDKESVDIDDFYQANDRVLAGLEKKNTFMNAKERELIAHHEAGHAVAGWFLDYADPLLKVTIIPRSSGALGFAQYLPKELQLYTADQLYDMMKMALGGRASEQIFFGRVSTGAADDLNKVTKIAYSQISVYGMNDRIGNLSWPPEQGEGFQGYRPYSEKTAELMDSEARDLVSKAYSETIQLLESRKDLVSSLASALLEKETLGHDELVSILGPRPVQNDAYREYLSNTQQFDEKYNEQSIENDVSIESDESSESSQSSQSSESSEREASVKFVLV